MKKFRLLAVLASVLLLASCAKDIETTQPDPEPIPGTMKDTYVVTMEEATNEVLSLLGDLDPATRSGLPARRIKEAFSIGGFGTTRSGDAEEEPLIYVFNFEDEQGFSLVAGDTRVPPVLCITESGSYHPDEEIDNPGFAIFMSEMDTSYRMAVGLPITDADGNVVTPEEYGYEPQSTGGITIGGGTLPFEPRPDNWTYSYGPYENYQTYGTILPAHTL